MRRCPQPQRWSHQHFSLTIFFVISQIIRYLLIKSTSRSCLIKSWCTEENIYCRVLIPHAVFPSSGFRARSAQWCHRWTRHPHRDFERCQMPAGLSPYLSIQLFWKPSHRCSGFQTNTPSVVPVRAAQHLHTVKTSCEQLDIPPKFATRRLSSIIRLVTAVLTALALLMEGKKLLSSSHGKS